MHWPDYVVLVSYFAMMIGIGIWASRRIKKQEDYFMGGRGFGKLLQTFAAFGAGTGSSDPVNTARTTFTSGMSGMWSVMSWLFVTPFYWIAGVWYRRMRHLTLGDWFVERYESKALGVGYTIFGLLFFMFYGSMFFSAIGKVAVPMMDVEVFVMGGQEYPIHYLLVPLIGVIVLAYGIAGGLEAAYYTDLIQGLCIIALSIMLIPAGLSELVAKFAPDSGESMLHGFKIMHDQLPAGHFNIIGSASSEFPFYMIAAVVVISLVGIVVQPHFIATGGGSAKNELTARVGLVTGNFLKRFCTVGWVLTALIALTLYSNNPELLGDPDKTWGVASRELLGPGLTGLMLACLLAALMSSVDAYMVVGSALVVRNIYAPYFNPNATEKQYITVGRITGVIVVAGSVLISLSVFDMFEQLQLTWVFPVLFAAPFWVGMFWRRATKAAAWITVGFCASMFFLIPFFAPLFFPALRVNASFLTTNEIVVTTTVRKASPSDVQRRNAEIEAWKKADTELNDSQAAFQSAMQDVQKAEKSDLKLLKKLSKANTRNTKALKKMNELEEIPTALVEKSDFPVIRKAGGDSVFWGSGVVVVDDEGNELKSVFRRSGVVVVDDEGNEFETFKPQQVGDREDVDENTTKIVLAYPKGTKFKGQGNFKMDFLIYKLFGMDFTTKSKSMLTALGLPPKIVAPFLVMILFSLITPRNSKRALDRYYAKMKTPVDSDPEVDRKNLEAAYANPEQLEQKKIFPGSSFEFQKPNVLDVVGFLVCVAACFGIIGLAVLVANVVF